MIYTGYFGGWHRYPGDAVFIAITRFPPDFWNYEVWDWLAPTEGLLRSYQNKDIDEYIFKLKFLRELHDRGLTPELVREKIKKEYRDKVVILMCYERPTDFCHRQVLAEWLGKDVKEYGT